MTMEKEEKLPKEPHRTHRIRNTVLTLSALGGLYAITNNTDTVHITNTEITVPITNDTNINLKNTNFLELKPSWTSNDRTEGSAQIFTNGTTSIIFILESNMSSSIDKLFQSYRNNPNSEGYLSVTIKNATGETLPITNPLVSIGKTQGNVQYEISYNNLTTAPIENFEMILTNHNSANNTSSQTFNLI